MKEIYECLGEVTCIIMGQAPPSDHCNNIGKGVPFVKAGEFGIRYPIIREWTTKPLKFASSNDVLICVVGATAGKINLGTDAAIGRSVAAIRPLINKLNQKYLYYFLHTWVGPIRAGSQGSAIGVITKDMIGKVSIALPLIETQEKIANALDKAQELIDKRKEQIEKLDEFLQSVFLDMFGDPINNPKGWDLVKVIDVCDCIVPGRDKPKSFTGDIPWITTADLKQTGFTLNSRKNIGLTIDEIKQVNAKLIPKGSVLLSCVGDLGITSISGIDLVMNQQLHSFQCSERVNNQFLKTVLPYRKDYMYKMASATTIPYMNKQVCNSIPIILPPLDLQNKFAEIVEKVEAQKELMQKSLSEMENNFNSIMQKAFKGELF